MKNTIFLVRDLLIILWLKVFKFLHIGFVQVGVKPLYIYIYIERERERERERR
jgi:hypothetical protein